MRGILLLAEELSSFKQELWGKCRYPSCQILWYLY